MPTAALYQPNITLLCHRHKCSSCRTFSGCPASVCRLQAVPSRSRDCHRARVRVLVNSCTESADSTSTHSRSQCLEREVLTPLGGLKASQPAKNGRPILSGGGGGIFFFWQLGMHLSLRHALECCASLALQQCCTQCQPSKAWSSSCASVSCKTCANNLNHSRLSVHVQVFHPVLAQTL